MFSFLWNCCAAAMMRHDAIVPGSIPRSVLVVVCRIKYVRTGVNSRPERSLNSNLTVRIYMGCDEQKKERGDKTQPTAKNGLFWNTTWMQCPESTPPFRLEMTALFHYFLPF